MADSGASQFDQLFIRDLIRRVHQELYASRQERLAAGQVPIFEVDKLVLEVNFVAIESTDIKGGIDFKIITAGAGGSYQHQQVHKVTLSMSAVTGHNDGLIDLELEDTTAFRPRRE